MRSPLIQDFHSNLKAYLANEISLETFKDWLAGAMFALDDDRDLETTDVAYEIIHLLAIFDDEGMTEEQLREALQPLAYSHSIP